jgi:hypothetical protein
VRSGAGHFLQHGTDSLGDQLQPGQVTHRVQDMSGVSALRGALAHESGLLQTRERQIEKTVGAVALGEALAEVGQDAMVEAGIVQLHRQGVLEIDAAADRFRCSEILDRVKLRTGATPRAMAAPENLAIGPLRHHARNPAGPLATLNIR